MRFSDIRMLSIAAVRPRVYASDRWMLHSVLNVATITIVNKT